jgi:hypothetical protein
MDDKSKNNPLETANSLNGIELGNAVVNNGTHNDERNMTRMGKIPLLEVRSEKFSDDVFMYSRDTSDDSNSCPSLASPLCLATLGYTH